MKQLLQNQIMIRIEDCFAYLGLIIKAYICAFVFTHCLIQPVYVKGESMAPTIQEGTIGFSNMLSYHLQGVDRFDIVLLEHGEDIWIKRVIALPHETIEMKDDVLYINGKAMKQPFLSNNIHTEDFGPVQLREDEVFVLGDNRHNSDDSRRIGAIPLSKIISTELYLLK